MPRSLLIGLMLVSRAYTEEKNALHFETDIRPILKAQCFDCHGEGKRPKGGLDLRLQRLMIEGGNDGPAIVPGQKSKSLLYQKVASAKMPPGKKKLTKEQIALLGKWIDQGAKTRRPEPKEVKPGLLVTEEERSHWAYQPIQRATLPSIPPTDRIRNPIDTFLLSRLTAKGLSFSKRADRATLIRRASFDLLGLPPSPEEVRRFVNDSSPRAWEDLIDRLLSSPRYGERWGRHWLDVAGYADSEGYSSTDTPRSYAFKYRDYVIDSFNDDLPWNTFIQEQLAGDEMKPRTNRRLIATGFLRMAPDGTGTGGVDQALARNQVMAETLKIVSTSLMGMTVGCAQCHNHRYDPIPQSDYYRLRAVFEPALNWKKWLPPNSRKVTLFTAEQRKTANEIEVEARKIDQMRLKKQQELIDRTFEKQLLKIPEQLREAAKKAYRTPKNKRTKEQAQLLRDHPALNVSAGSLYLYDRKAADELKRDAAKAAKIRATKPKPDYIRALVEKPGAIPVTYLFHRGDHEQPKDKLLPAGLSIFDSQNLKPIPVNDKALPTTGRRLAFAQRLTDGRHPLTARVLMNRVWMHHFGRGIVSTPSDFGILGARPTHPQLLDWLASEFMRGGWKLKRMHKLIMTSWAYQQISTMTEKHRELDPDNQLIGRMSVRRLEAEAMRDAILAVSGELNLKQKGKPIPVTVDLTGMVVIGVDTRDSAGRPTRKQVSLNGEEHRRSVYVQVRRSMPLAVLETFDAPILAPNCEVRSASTVAPQSLLMMNSGFITKSARVFADRLRRECGKDLTSAIRRGWMLAFGTEPSAADVKESVEFVTAQTKQFQKQNDKKLAPAREALASFCQALLSANAFLYVS